MGAKTQPRWGGEVLAVLEVGGLDVLSLSGEDWTVLQHKLSTGTEHLPVVSVRREERTQTGAITTLK